MTKFGATPTASPLRRRTRTPIEWNVPTHSPCALSPTSACSRERSSPAALFVKVTAKMRCAGARSVASKCATRWVSTRVLPLPAPAKIKTAPSVCDAAARCSSLSCSSGSTSARSGHSLSAPEHGAGRHGGVRFDGDVQSEDGAAHHSALADIAAWPKNRIADHRARADGATVIQHRIWLEHRAARHAHAGSEVHRRPHADVARQRGAICTPHATRELDADWMGEQT